MTVSELKQELDKYKDPDAEVTICGGLKLYKVESGPDFSLDLIPYYKAYPDEKSELEYKIECLTDELTENKREIEDYKECTEEADDLLEDLDNFLYKTFILKPATDDNIYKEINNFHEDIVRARRHIENL